MKRLLRGVVAIGNTISGEHLALNYKKLSDALEHGLGWQRPEDGVVFERIRAHVTEHDEIPTLEILRHSVGDDIELQERLKDIAAAEVHVRSNYHHLVRDLTESHLKIRVSAALKEANDILKKEGRDRALAFLGDKLPALQSLASKTPKMIPSVGVSTVFEPLPPIPWLCEGLRLAPGGVAMFAGYGYSGKTIVAQHIGVCVASGLPVFGVHPITKGRVLHLDYEQGSRLTFERYQRLAAGMGITKDDLGDRLCVAVMPDTCLDAKDAAKVFEATIQGFSLVIIDSFKASSPNTEENASSARIPLDLLARVAEKTGALPLVIDHARKPKEDAAGGAKMTIRGSSAKFDALTTSFVFTAEKGAPTRVQHEKCRHRGTTLPDFGFRVMDVESQGDPRGGLMIEHLDGVTLEGAIHGASAEADRTKIDAAKSKIRTYLGTKPDGFVGNRADLRTASDGGNHQVFTKALRELEEAAQVTVSGTKEKTFRLAVVDTRSVTNGKPANDDDLVRLYGERA